MTAPISGPARPRPTPSVEARPAAQAAEAGGPPADANLFERLPAASELPRRPARLTRAEGSARLAGTTGLFAQPALLAVAVGHALEQGLWAVSLWCARSAAERLAAGETCAWQAAGFVACAHLLPAALRPWQTHAREAWKAAALTTYDEAFAAHIAGRPELHVCQATGHDERGRITQLAAENLRWGVENAVLANEALLAAAARGVGRLAVVSGGGDLGLTAGVATALILTQSLGWASQESVARAHVRRQQAMRALMAHGRSAVDNVVLGNRLNLEAWRGANADLASASADAEIANEDLRGQIRLGMTALAAAPMLAGLAPSLAPLWRGEVTAEWASVILPRVVAWGESVDAVAGAASLVWSRWTNMQGNFTRARKNLLALAPLDLAAHIDAAKIRVEGAGLSLAGEDALEHVAAAIASGRPGRLTLRGDNGAGKSMFLLSLKHTLGDRGVLLPARHALLMPEITGSTGERALAGLRDVCSNLRDDTVLLLDEPLANFDAKTRASASAWIDRQAERRLIVEIDHKFWPLKPLPVGKFRSGQNSVRRRGWPDQESRAARHFRAGVPTIQGNAQQSE